MLSRELLDFLRGRSVDCCVETAGDDLYHWVVASLASLLPLSACSSVFVRVDETAVQLWKAIVVGPEDTPYSGGCFLFDFYFPASYPNAPPQ
ncbi:putative ubiquitin-conjugating enzyme protein 17, partial [Tetrabaena socialis]